VSRQRRIISVTFAFQKHRVTREDFENRDGRGNSRPSRVAFGTDFRPGVCRQEFFIRCRPCGAGRTRRRNRQGIGSIIGFFQSGQIGTQAHCLQGPKPAVARSTIDHHRQCRPVNDMNALSVGLGWRFIDCHYYQDRPWIWAESDGLQPQKCKDGVEASIGRSSVRPSPRGLYKANRRRSAGRAATIQRPHPASNHRPVSQVALVDEATARNASPVMGGGFNSVDPKHPGRASTAGPELVISIRSVMQHVGILPTALRKTHCRPAANDGRSELRPADVHGVGRTTGACPFACP